MKNEAKRKRLREEYERNRREIEKKTERNREILKMQEELENEDFLEIIRFSKVTVEEMKELLIQQHKLPEEKPSGKSEKAVSEAGGTIHDGGEIRKNEET